MKNIVVLISGRGSNFKAVHEAAKAQDWENKDGLRISGVISNRADAAGLLYAAAEGIPSEVVDHKQFASREAFEEKLVEAARSMGADLIVLAGFMRILTPTFINAFAGKILNIHPALLPLFPGLHTHQRALDAGVRIHGVTVHFVTEELDAGSIVGQAAVGVLASDDADSLAARVLKQEHVLYPRATRLVALGKVRLVDGRTVMDDEAARQLAIFG